MDEKPKAKRGFAVMDPEKRREIARRGGRGVPGEKRSFSANPKLAREAGKKGGMAVKSEKRAFSVDRGLAQSAGKAGAKSRAADD